MELDDLSRSYYAAQIALVNSISVFVLALWALVDPLKPTSSWIGQRIGERLFVATSTGQLSAARGAEQFVTRAVQAQAVTPDPKALVQPKALAGIASDGRQLDTLLVQPLIQNEYALSKGATPEAAHALGRNSLDTIVTTQVADAARAANATAMATEPAVEGWVRMLVPPSCGRCADLAGKFYPWDAEFVRHPRCDCLQIPSTDKKLTADLRTDPKLYFESLSVADQNKYFGAGRAEQIRQGADISQTVAVKSQAAGLSSPGSESIARPMPAALIAEGRGDRDETVRLLRQHGFVD